MKNIYIAIALFMGVISQNSTYASECGAQPSNWYVQVQGNTGSFFTIDEATFLKFGAAVGYRLNFFYLPTRIEAEMDGNWIFISHEKDQYALLSAGNIYFDLPSARGFEPYMNLSE